MSYTAEEKRLLQDYLADHPCDELEPYLKTEEVHHIFGKYCKALKTNQLNFVALSRYMHDKAEFRDVQITANAIFELKIKQFGQAFVDFADKYGGKLWRVYKESNGISK